MAKRIVYFQHSFPNATETFVLAEVRELIRRGYDIWVVTLKRIHELADATGFGERILEVGAAPSFQERLQLACNQIQQLGAAYLHTPWATEVQAAVVHLASALQIPFGFSCHAVDIWCRGVRVEPELLGAYARLPLCKTVAVEGSYHQRYLLACGAPAEKVVIVPNAVDASRLPGGRSTPPERLRRIIAVGRPVAKKGFLFGVDAIRLLRAAGHEVELEVIGGADISTLEGQRLAEYANHFPFISPSGMMKHEDTLKRIATADALLMPSVVVSDTGDSDGIPTVLAEAMLLGVPVVATDVGSVTDLVVPGVTGFVARAGDPASLAEQLLQLHALLADRPRATAFFAHARAHALRQEIQASVNTLVRHLEQQLGRF